MQGSEYAGLVLYAFGVIGFLGLVVAFLFQTRSRRLRVQAEVPRRSESIEIHRLHAARELEAPEIIAYKIEDNVPMVRLHYPNLKTGGGEFRIAELSMDVGLSILEATRGQERRLSKAKAEELLTVLRDELAIAPKDLTPAELVQAIRARLISLTEMMSEAQLSLTDLEHRVSDIDSIVKQLPAIVNDHRRHIGSLHQSIDELTAKAATKQEFQQLQKELDTVKWAIATVLAIILAILGALLKKAM
jgi:hypothetical protein